MAECLLLKTGGGVGSDDVTATKAQVLTGYTAVTSDSDDEAVAGTMPNNGAMNASLNAGGSKVIPAGYTTGGTVTAKSLASQTAATATAANITSGETAWVNGAKVTGTGADNTANYNNGYSAGHTAGYNEGYAVGGGILFFAGILTTNGDASQTLVYDPDVFTVTGVQNYTVKRAGKLSVMICEQWQQDFRYVVKVNGNIVAQGNREFGVSIKNVANVNVGDTIYIGGTVGTNASRGGIALVITSKNLS